MALKVNTSWPRVLQNQKFNIPPIRTAILNYQLRYFSILNYQLKNFSIIN